MDDVDDAVVRDFPARVKAQDGQRVALFGTANTFHCITQAFHWNSAACSRVFVDDEVGQIATIVQKPRL